MKANQIGYVLRGSTSGCVAGCRVANLQHPRLGSMVRIPLENDQEVYGLVTDMHIDDDGLVRQLVTAENIQPEVIADNRVNRTVPVEISIIFIGYRTSSSFYHLLPPQPPLTLDEVLVCSRQDVRAFSSAGKLGYFRHILRGSEFPVAEVLASHLRQAAAAHHEAHDPEWINTATQELITLLRDDYPTLMNVLGALSDARLNQPEEVKHD